MAVVARVHAREPRSRANGPGTRFVIWLQGCTLGCAGCFNPATHATGGAALTTDALLAEVTATRGVDGLTLSGGEPMQQAAAALELVLGARRLGLSTLMFSGYTRAELAAQALGPAVLAHLDVLVDGRYQASARTGHGLRGSANQVVHLLTGRHRRDEVEATPTTEIRIARDGSVVLTGVDPLKRV
ncbi:MAG: radical SAM protein [Kofleriaceae bacterium]|nr:radical SAM protein [Kofleriaceae bacterium]MCL4226694.1 4Fe-4S cluster-binding domain-containing protein [Myxococcales bacterium]